VPSIEGADNKAEIEFNLTVYSDREVDLRKVDDQHSQIVTGEFNSGNAGGSYIYSLEFLKRQETWSKNPKFILKLFPGESEQDVHFKLSLSRPMEKWQEKLDRNKVGSMIGI